MDLDSIMLCTAMNVTCYSQSTTWSVWKVSCSVIQCTWQIVADRAWTEIPDGFEEYYALHYNERDLL